MTRLVVALILALAVAAPAWAAQNTLTWMDNSDNEENFNIERKVDTDGVICGTTGIWGALASVGPNVTTYTDTAVTEGTTYCYRVNASNPAGASAWSNEAGRTVPFSVPAPPSGLTAS